MSLNGITSAGVKAPMRSFIQSAPSQSFSAENENLDSFSSQSEDRVTLSSSESSDYSNWNTQANSWKQARALQTKGGSEKTGLSKSKSQGAQGSKRTGKTSSPKRASNVDYGLKVAREHYRRTTYNSSDILQWSGKADPKDPGVVIITASSNDRYSKEKLSCKVVNGKVTEWSRSRSDSDSVMGEMGVGRPR